MTDTTLTKEQMADARLDDAEHEAARLATKKPHPRDYGAVIFESENGPGWAIGSHFDRLLYHRDSASYWRAKYEGLTSE